MLVTPNELSEVIGVLAGYEAKAIPGASLTNEAELRIGRIPPNYALSEVVEIDLHPLRSMIRDVVKQAYLLKASIDGPTIEQALKRVKCHYLWFC